MVLYADSAIFAGFILNFLCIDSAVSVTGVKVKKRRIAVGALLLSALSILCLLNIYIRFLYFFVYIAAIRVICGKCRTPELIRRVGAGICTCLLYSAILLAVIPTEKMWILTAGGGTFFVPEDIYFYTPLLAVYLAVKLIMFLITRNKKVFSVRIQINGQVAVADAIIDTGNSLRDRETQSPVIIAEKSLFGHTDAVPKFIRYKNIGQDKNYTKIYPVEKLSLLEEHRDYENIYVAFVDKPLSSSGKYRVLLHNSFMV